MKIRELPDKFFLNLTVSDSRQLDQIKRITLRDKEKMFGRRYRVRGVTQFNTETKHFRTIKDIYAEGGYRWYLLDDSSLHIRSKFPDALNP